MSVAKHKLHSNAVFLFCLEIFRASKVSQRIRVYPSDWSNHLLLNSGIVGMEQFSGALLKKLHNRDGRFLILHLHGDK